QSAGKTAADIHRRRPMMILGGSSGSRSMNHRFIFGGVRLTRRGSMARQAIFEMSLHIGPLGQENAVHHAVAHRPVAARAMVAEDAVFLGPQGLDRPLRGEVEVVGAESDHFAPERVEGVAEQ